MEKQEFKLKLGEDTITITKSILAGQANGSVLASWGETTVLATAVMGKRREGIDFFPLMVDYEERFYAAGKISGSRFMKREGKASQEAVLTSRLIDRSLRPLFNHALRNDIQVIITVLSLDQEHDSDILAILAASTALLISDIPWAGPIAAVRVGSIDRTLVINPLHKDRESSSLDLIVAGTAGKINMLEGGAKEVPEDQLLEAFTLAQKYIRPLIDFQNTIKEAIGKEKMRLEIKTPDEELAKRVHAFLGKKLDAVLYESDKKTRGENLGTLKKELEEHIAGFYPEEAGKIKEAGSIFEEQIDKTVHENILKHDKRPDGRKTDELRGLEAHVGLLPRTHGSGLFVRGETQVLSVLTLGGPGDQQLVDGMEGKEERRFMHHYNFPPYSVGEVGPMRGPGRRDIGHGALAERALMPLIPEQKDFPYTIRLVSETLSSNGSSSMASVCGSMLAMMDGGVPISKVAGGIAMGLMMDDKGAYKVLTDIQGPEDHHGDMDLKVAGTEDGVTALQMDVKIEGITTHILKDALAQAKKARLEIIAAMQSAIAKPREDLSQYAPRIITLEINPEKIKDVIGPGGKMINEIINETGVSIDIEDDGFVFITSVDAASAQKAVEWVKNITREARVGEIFQAKVKKIMEFGAFVEIFPGTEGLVHISKLSATRVARVEDVVKIGDIIPVKLMEIDGQGRLNLSLKDALEKNDK
ncbi:polyribonucleotide nucleotidyltransferase [Candidatus Azambacteria bacterium RIFCSPHIGHO2_02_FULL_52_12]|uniref:Polyribonucleotide nucleotidyltransferase n=1 Tax=Candidatus Azambacteria bacterium RIFCSPLOWO2_01_FULL_46_25 TaxID=1797298 RepID=A0A1F5BUV4_9BACT|nr:MAG: polyribonucleotide nucleotidyltransferase [Candidatus Azambacteria bacterium RIFCSPHIGHO2_02_FULL_52_12]OGD34328.1 MAG: polyribonucleotide nucleotidyltransferase [Candidatus Azambacteria bacterium RIFCSPLOWO2_01_FULL_46_25]OGD37394.1 MAG: polyribonucleotide nucleotidyltransferase [Candidatus Azambacteria bacterium RIFCSPHIGHO2_01_FULL_51_74]